MTYVHTFELIKQLGENGMAVAETSKQALEAIRPELKGRRKEVLLAIKELGEANNLQIAEHLDLPINCVTGRVTELHNYGYIEVAFVAKGSTGNSMKYWALSANQDDAISTKEQDCE